MKLRLLSTGPGLLATIQDLGRPQARGYGVPLSGAMDTHSHVLANLLLGNAPEAATLECTGGKLDAIVEKGGRLALSGAGGALYIDGRSVPAERAIGVPDGALLTIQPMPGGNFSYLATAGGWKLAPVFGSASTYLAGGFGGHEGRALKKGDVLRAALELDSPSKMEIAFWFFRPDGHLVPRLETPLVISVLQGSEWPWWKTAQQKAFLNNAARISKDRSRQAVRIEGLAALGHNFTEIYSTGVSPGAIQIPPGDDPAILMADAQTMGGFPRIAQVIAVDLPKIAQAKTGQVVRFQMVDLAEASQRLMDYELEVKRLGMAERFGSGRA
ncbi:MAG: biotin-dependent carboxyltransferase family protein [Saprospiraceae bacterium]|nr:biotin-dependent carboxyltransferase family protein [Saprospiraceae bacterium]MDZ4703890.1 biotin-dependent carboxyltransferase family protein [Saprospiraceae bacterium]